VLGVTPMQQRKWAREISRALRKRA
jgi:hypothetical protein